MRTPLGVAIESGGQMTEAYCTQCGERLQPGTRYCGKCGAAVGPDAGRSTSLGASQENDGNACPKCGSFNRRRTQPVLLAVGTVVLVLAVAAFAFFGLMYLRAPSEIAAARQNGLTYVGDSGSNYLSMAVVLSILGGGLAAAGLFGGRPRCANCGFDSAKSQRNAVANLTDSHGSKTCLSCGKSSPESFLKCQWCGKTL